MFEVVGVRMSSFTDQSTGQQITGTRIYYTFVEDGITGVGCDSAFFTTAKLAGYDPKPGDIVDIRYNRQGRIQSITKLTD